MGSTTASSRKGVKPSQFLKGTQFLYKVKNKVRAPLPVFRFLNRNKETFECPICGYKGPFADFRNFGGFRRHAVCPQCGALERHRLQYLVMRDVLKITDASSQKTRMLHFAPEEFFRPIFSKRFPKYETADLFMKEVDHHVDIRDLPFQDGSYDFVFASHVLEHIREDGKAIEEIRRVLGPNGIAVLPVPIVSASTIEYPEANPYETGHMRAPGLDYFERYKEHFGRVEIHSSSSFPEKYQLFVYEDRSVWPTAECPLRPPMQGERHADFVPVCYV
jgi:SAM-dependent methyltransferase